ncbi:helix-turn-helix domain-containing protein [Lacticaseibacillus mingshuiensis]|uniref:helix-turn-helix domain-containing protein n=1 Tax=Lacticaseibacillus mingshuiensis TaxID=2799574 RepID=UPI00194E7553|nr:XRE family transcriptional regulator [Lacticaseibacillus mingshuiensis]
MTETLFGKRLHDLRLLKKMSQQQLADSLNKWTKEHDPSNPSTISKSMISRWETGNTDPQMFYVRLVTKYFGVNPEAFMNEAWSLEDDIIDNSVNKNVFTKVNDILPIYNKLHPERQQNVYTYAEDQLKQQQNKNVVPFPEQREVVCGRGTAAGAPIDGATQDADVRRTRVNVDDIPASADEIVTVEGDSMEPDYPKYSQIFVRWQDTIDDGDLAVVRVADEGVTFKQVSRDYQQKKIVLHSLNDKYPDRYLDPEDVSIIGVVLN